MLPSSIANTLAAAVWHDDEFAPEKQQLKREIALLSNERTDASAKHAQHVREARQHVNLLFHKMETLRQEELPLHVYASAIKEQQDACSSSATPSHVLLLQAQLCRAIHYMSVDSVQLQLQENLRETLLQLAKNQQRVLLEELLFFVESRTELKLQQEEYADLMMVVEDSQQQQQQQDDKQPSIDIDDLVNSLNELQVHTCSSDKDDDSSSSLNLDDDWEQVAKSSDNDHDIHFILDDDDEEEVFHKSLPTIQQEGTFSLSASEKKQRALSLIATGTWNSEKHNKVPW